MTNQDILNAYIKQIKDEMKPFLSEIDVFFEKNKDKENLYFLLNQEFSDKITTFTNKYSGSCPVPLVYDEIFKRIAFSKTVEICNSLVHYLDHLMENGLQNAEQNPSS